MAAVLCTNAAASHQIAITSLDVRQAFRAAGMRARVADLGMKFRICDLDRSQYGAEVERVARTLKFTDSLGHPGGQWNTSTEFVAYKPGKIVRLSAQC
ncbi:hypothetical protein [Paraburkholderia fungorum]|uniref:Uncharacterized protein n=1 Tax=Paraburkholderia fungorum TaxID=134537 RepID=A0AAW3V0E1_9BURK|nr:hypothetical protein [Paraburkholderia fungorum]MBB4517338.1 hypothetical protein [Paraburkholderia fungorum]MBB6204407.1 hypothetical protein [Paraburkholderia fungorum]